MPSASSVAKTAPKQDLSRRLNQALKLRSAKRYGKAKEILVELTTTHSSSASVFGLLGDVYWKLDSLDDAIRSFTRACKLAPDSELASLGLFHTLWESGRRNLALNEMERFLSRSHSAEYARLLRELITRP
jgi:predicted Zn-dependent protease